MARNWIVVGDTTTSGGTVVSGSPFTDIDGRACARLGDKVACAQHGPTTIASGDETMIIDGQPQARDGDGCACGCKLVSLQQMHVYVDAGGGGGGNAAATSTAATAALAAAKASAVKARASDATAQYDEAFILKSEATGKPLANRRYKIIRSNGSSEEGTTDEEGMTRLVTSDAAETLKIELGEEGP